MRQQNSALDVISGEISHFHPLTKLTPLLPTQILDLRAPSPLPQLRAGLLQQMQPFRVGDLATSTAEARACLPELLHASQELVDVVVLRQLKAADSRKFSFSGRDFKAFHAIATRTHQYLKFLSATDTRSLTRSLNRLRSTFQTRHEQKVHFRFDTNAKDTSDSTRKANCLEKLTKN